MKKEPKGKHACTVTVGEKGQIVIPKKVRDMMGITPGDVLLLLCDEKQGLAIPPASKTSSIIGKIFAGAMPNITDEEEADETEKPEEE